MVGKIGGGSINLSPAFGTAQLIKLANE